MEEDDNESTSDLLETKVMLHCNIASTVCVLADHGRAVVANTSADSKRIRMRLGSAVMAKVD
jgi:hypothetical protein